MSYANTIRGWYRLATGLSVFQIIAMEIVSQALSFAFELPWGVLADRIGYRRTMIVCNVLFLISKIAFWVSCIYHAARTILNALLAFLEVLAKRDFCSPL